jgi:hypothetical protein
MRGRVLLVLAFGGLMAILGVALFGYATYGAIADAGPRVGQTGHLRSLDGSVTVFVNDLGHAAFERAFNNRDQAGMQRAMATFETFGIPATTTVRLTALKRSAIQVEAVDGPQAGRRGWTSTDAFVP